MIGHSDGLQFNDEYEAALYATGTGPEAPQRPTGALKPQQATPTPSESPSEDMTVYIGRHGKTDLNNTSSASQDFIRGHMDVPLNEEGVVEAHRMADNLPKDVTQIYSSDLQRAKKTADIIGKKNNKYVDVSEEFRPWDVGEFAGQPSKTAVPKLVEYAENKPDEKVPGGESFNDFKQRALGGFARVVQAGGTPLILTHHRFGQLISAHDWETGETDPKIFGAKGPDPGTITKHEVPVKLAGDVIDIRPQLIDKAIKTFSEENQQKRESQIAISRAVGRDNVIQLPVIKK